MEMQGIAWILSLLLIAIIAGVFVFFVVSSRRREPYEPIQRKGYKLRPYLFIGVVIILVIVSVVTLRDLPYYEPVTAEDAEVVDVEAYQFGWEMSSQEFEVGEPIEFHVTSADVNHGFGIYDEDMILHAQTQAMPGYTNVVYHTFTEPGTYEILCLEYCGVAHHAMIEEIEIVAAD